MEQKPNIALVPVERDLDVTTVDAERTVIDRLIEGGCRRIILNMAGATYVDSAGMALLLTEVRRMRGLGGLISLTNVSEPVLAILRRARLVDFVPVSSEARKALDPLPAPSTPPRWRTAVPIDKANLAATRGTIERLLAQSPLSPDERFDANLAVGEAMGNAVDHTSGEGAQVTLTGYDDRVVMEVTDRGPGFDPNALATAKIKHYAERGRGIRLMMLLADSVSIRRRTSGPGMAVRLVKLAHGAN